METTTRTLSTPDVDLVYDVIGPLPPSGGLPVLLMAGHPMTAEGFRSLASFLGDRTVVTYDPRGLGRSGRKDGRQDRGPQLHAADLHALIEHLATGPVDVFASSGGAVNALELVTSHPGDVRILVAHEPPVLGVLPDAEQAFAAEQGFQRAYHDRGFGAGMAGFIAFTSWRGQFTDTFSQTLPDPTQLGLPTDDDGSRVDPLLSGASDAITGYTLDVDALTDSSTLLVMAAGIESREVVTGRTTVGVAAALGLPVTEFPGHHGGFLGGEHGYAGTPEAFAVRLREVLAGTEDPELVDLRRRADHGDPDAVDQLVELAGERGDVAELRHLAEAGSTDAGDVLVEVLTEREDLDGLRRLADSGNVTAREVVEELTAGTAAAATSASASPG